VDLATVWHLSALLNTERQYHGTHPDLLQTGSPRLTVVSWRHRHRRSGQVARKRITRQVHPEANLTPRFWGRLMRFRDSHPCQPRLDSLLLPPSEESVEPKNGIPTERWDGSRPFLLSEARSIRLRDFEHSTFSRASEALPDVLGTGTAKTHSGHHGHAGSSVGCKELILPRATSHTNEAAPADLLQQLQGTRFWSPIIGWEEAQPSVNDGW